MTDSILEDVGKRHSCVTVQNGVTIGKEYLTITKLYMHLPIHPAFPHLGICPEDTPLTMLPYICTVIAVLHSVLHFMAKYCEIPKWPDTGDCSMNFSVIICQTT